MTRPQVFQEEGVRLPARGEFIALRRGLLHRGAVAAAVTGRATPPLARWMLLRLLRLLLWRGWMDLVALAFLAALALYFFRDAFSYRVFYENDTAVFYYPLAHRIDRSLEEGALPLWTRAIFAGYPLYADGETGVFYPLNLLLHHLLPAWQAFVWRRVISFVIGAWGMYAFGRAMGLRPFGAAVAAVVFAFGSFLVAQMHHANVLGSAIWLPFVFFAVEMALRSLGRRRFQWLVLGGLALGLQSLAVHIQVVAMTLLALGPYLGYRLLLGPAAVRLLKPPSPELRSFYRRLLTANANVWLTVLQRAVAVMAALVLVVGLGLGLGGVQLLPLWDLAQFSARSVGMPYSFAATYALPPLGLLQALQPYLFRTAAGAPWAGGAPWESSLYLGIPALLLAATGVLFARNRHTLFFAGLLVLSLLVALGPDSPFNLHRVLWELPGFSYLRAPGRFSLLAIFAGAALAGWGAHWLDRQLAPAFSRGQKSTPASGGPWRSVWFSLFLGLAGLLPLLATWGLLSAGAWLSSHKAETLKLLGQRTWVEPRGATPEAIERAYQGLLWALGLTNPATVTTVALLGATFVLLTLWYGAPRMGHLAKGALLGVLTVDLLAFAAAFHPQIAFSDLTAANSASSFLGAAGHDDRALNRSRLRSMEENRLLPLGIQVLNGYSSLAPQRHLEFLRPLRVGHDVFPDVLVDTASIRYIFKEAAFSALPSYKLVSFDPSWPLVQGAASNPGATATFAAGGARGDTLGIVSTLQHGTTIPNDTPVAELVVTTETGERRSITLRAGRHVSEWAYDRPDVRPIVRHAQAEMAFDFKNTDLDGREYDVRLYYGELPLGRPLSAKTVEFRYTYPAGSLRLYGLSLFDSKTLAFSQLRQKTKYRTVYQDGEALIYENLAPLPRTYVVGQAVERSSGPDILRDMIEGGFDPRQAVMLEDPAGAGFPRDVLVSERPPSLPTRKSFFAPAQLSSYDATSARISYSAPDAGYLVFSDSYYPGWKAFLDGQPVPLYRANYLFRAVRAPAGNHTVEFLFEPAILRLGYDLTLMSLGLASLVLLLPELWALIRALARRVTPLRFGQPAGPSLFPRRHP